MFLHGTSKIDASGELLIGGCSVVSLAEQFGTPLIVYDEELIVERIRSYQKAFEKARMDYYLAYASKAFSSLAMCQLAKEQGLWLDVVSAGELHTALKASFDPKHVYMHGNNKTLEELRYAVQAGIAFFVVDNFLELELLSTILEEEEAFADILLRVSPGVDAHTHEYITTGQQDSKFGFDLASGQVSQAVARVLELHRLHLIGLHSHIGSQIFESTGFAVAASRMADLWQQLQQEFSIDLRVLNLGGGIGIRYTSEDMMPPIENTVYGVLKETEKAFVERGLTVPLLIMEPGRSLVGEAGTTLYRVGSRKDIPGVRSYLSIDGGMTDNPRLALYGARYEACIGNRMLEPATDLVSVAGKACESGDMLIWDIHLAKSQPGDILAVSCTGAYNYSMASNYNRIARPAVVFVKDGQARLVIQRETLDDLVRLDVIGINRHVVHSFS